MSFVSIVSTTKFISVMSDGRASDIDGPQYEDFKKIDRVDDSFVAYTGMIVYCLPLKERIIKLLNVGTEYKIIKDIALKEIEKIKNDNGKMNIVFGGKNSQGGFELYLFSTSIEGFEYYRPLENKVQFNYLGSDVLIKSGIDIGERFKYHFVKSNKVVVEAQKRLQIEVASFDKSVNHTIFHIAIE